MLRAGLHHADDEMATPLPPCLSMHDTLEKVPRVNEREVKTPSGKVVLVVCEMAIANNAVLQYATSLPESRETVGFPPPVTVTLQMSPEVFGVVLRDDDAAVELNNKIHVLCRNGAVFMMRAAGVRSVEKPDIVPFVDVLIADPLPLQLGERPEVLMQCLCCGRTVGVCSRVSWVVATGYVAAREVCADADD